MPFTSSRLKQVPPQNSFPERARRVVILLSLLGMSSSTSCIVHHSSHNKLPVRACQEITKFSFKLSRVERSGIVLRHFVAPGGFRVKNIIPYYIVAYVILLNYICSYNVYMILIFNLAWFLALLVFV
jgi:hypothetical protein